MHADLKAVQMTITRATDHIMGQKVPTMVIVRDLDEAYRTLDVLMRENKEPDGVSSLYDDGTVYSDTLEKEVEKTIEKAIATEEAETNEVDDEISWNEDD